MVREIPLTQGQVALVDDEDYERVAAHKWNAFRRKHTWYARRSVRGGVVYLHAFILQPEPPLLPDHIDGNGLDNRRQNLRPATRQQNHWNRHAPPRSESGFLGVSRSGRGWEARIRVGPKKIRIGLYDTPEEAARAFDERAREMRGEFGYLNFPLPGERSAA